MRRLIATVFLTCTLAACSSDLPQAPSSTLTATCTQHDLTDPRSVPECLLGRRTISQDDHDSAIALLTRARAMADSFRALGGTGAEFDNAARIDRALGLITSFQQRDLFTDSARFHRILDAVSVAMEVSSGSALVQGGVIRPATTPHLLWYSYPGLGAFFQPVTTAQTVANLVPKTTVTNDSMLAVGQALYDYAIWREADGLRFPVWEYEFTWTSGGITNDAPWTSGMAQGLVMSIFADCYQRTGNPIWKDRAYEVLNSFKVNWA
ncbi:MAG TPA: D-glucuronyl C5-epimerase family protein, partial [Gemmatimonadales bacterium]|nr:D-glucuronyl C5-epimerase family protein [Gemmatimonadales bacterium]